MEELQQKHRQEQKDLQARILQKKKSATKRTRRGINDECVELERQLKERQNLELSTNNGEAVSNGHSVGPNDIGSDLEPNQTLEGDGLTEPQTQNLALPSPQLKDERTRKPNRQKARLARRAAEQESVAIQAAKEAQDLPDLRSQESDAMRIQYSSRGLKEHEIRSDGHCLYAAVADQLVTRKQGLMPKSPLHDMSLGAPLSSPQYKTTRLVTASYISAHAEDFLPFMEEPLDEYLRKIRETGEWGGHLELLALAKAYHVVINVLQSNGQIETIGSATDGAKPSLWLSYYHHNFGLGEHYNSLRQAD
ncbi:MAG: hypothetical protein Q9181_000077 [Wetmoreana brouardii]